MDDLAAAVGELERDELDGGDVAEPIEPRRELDRKRISVSVTEAPSPAASAP